MFCTSFLSHDVENLILKLVVTVFLFAKFLGIQRENVVCHHESQSGKKLDWGGMGESCTIHCRTVGQIGDRTVWLGFFF